MTSVRILPRAFGPPAVNGWIGSLFDPMHRDETVTRLLEADDSYIDQLGNVARALDRPSPEHLEELYAALRLVLTYQHVEKSVDVVVDPMGDRVDKVCVRGGT
ncbi:hypothetical protein [Kribbella speibonae]|uniref:Uncharacterized protein n=1 Tax=Kribbella speibonae TaxID=1572660 RepID=A0ABY2A8R4_9ACTN|nr:hypothetical protein [Kribbella speibonae]TCC24852.1 hypothetical protein E0H58_11655 [Kribbella speibonae]